ncbi:hypothetical protein SO802_006988 [Lithocarpus litseifolius]|uniref:Uncharacterized protein n=1 Tax=Lithocarpus litseifolius TaxID=425828 RepID=A0AAW2DME5_9ROSI
MWKPNMGGLSHNLQLISRFPPISQTRNVGKENDLTSLELLSLGPGPSLLRSPETSTLQNPLLDPTGISTSILNARSPSDNSRKRIKKEIEKFGRNIKQCYLLHKTMLIQMKGVEKLALNSFPNNHENTKLELQKVRQPLCSSTVPKKG